MAAGARRPAERLRPRPGRPPGRADRVGVEEVPKKAISMGMNSIFKAKKIILLASGENKHKAIKFISQSKYISTEVPASILHLHSDVTLIVDEKAYNGK